MHRSSLDLQTLRIFLEISRDCNMSRAAESLGLTQSAVSQAVHRLEAAVGAELLDRHSRPLTLTVYGRNLIQYAAPLVASLDGLIGAIRPGSGRYPLVTAGYSESVSATSAPWLTSYLETRSDKVVIETGMTAELIEAFLNDDIDILIGPVPLLDTDGLWREKVYEEEFLLVLPGKAEDAPQAPAEEALKDAASRLPVLIYNGQSADREMILKFTETLSFPAFERYAVESSRTMMGLALLGEGWTVIPPANIWQGRDFVSGLRLERLPGAPIVRPQYVIAKEGIYSKLAADLASQFSEILEKEIRPRFSALNPILSDAIHQPRS